MRQMFRSKPQETLQKEKRRCVYLKLNPRLIKKFKVPDTIIEMVTRLLNKHKKCLHCSFLKIKRDKLLGIYKQFFSKAGF